MSTPYMFNFAPTCADRIVLSADDVDITRSPLAGQFEQETIVLAAFSPGLLRLPSGNLLIMAQVVEALRDPVEDGLIHALCWNGSLQRYTAALPPLNEAGPSPGIKGRVTVRTLLPSSVSWLLPVELTPDGLQVVHMHYDRAISPRYNFQRYGIGGARISFLGDRWLMTACSLGSGDQATTLYASPNGLDWTLEGVISNRQFNGMVIFQGKVGGYYWAATEIPGSFSFCPPLESKQCIGTSTGFILSMEGLCWKAFEGRVTHVERGGCPVDKVTGAVPPILTPHGWLMLWHGVKDSDSGETHGTYWSLLDKNDPSILLRSGEAPLLHSKYGLMRLANSISPLQNTQLTTGIADGGDFFILASSENDSTCRISHIEKSEFI